MLADMGRNLDGVGTPLDFEFLRGSEQRMLMELWMEKRLKLFKGAVLKSGRYTCCKVMDKLENVEGVDTI